MEKQIIFSEALAKKIGVQNAIVLCTIYQYHGYDEVPMDQIVTLFPFWGRSTIANRLKTLTELDQIAPGGGDSYTLTSQPPSLKKTPSPKNAPQKPKSSVHEMNELIFKLTNTDQKLVGYRRYLKFAKQLVEAGYTPDQLTTHYAKPNGTWYTQAFKGKKGEFPTQSDITRTIKTYIDEHTKTSEWSYLIHG